MPSSLERQVLSNNDDAHEADDGTGFDAANNVCTMQPSADPAQRFNCGIRFTNITISQGDKVQLARLRLASPLLQNNARCDIHCEDVDDADDFAATADVTSRVRTTASVVWRADAILPINVLHALDLELAPLVQEVVDRPSWVSGNAIVFLFVGKNEAGPFCSFIAHDLSPPVAASLSLIHGQSDLTPDLALMGIHVIRMPDRVTSY